MAEWLAAAPPTGNGARILANPGGDLHYAETEASWIEQVLQRPPTGPVEVLLQERATLEAVLMSCSARILHLACHASLSLDTGEVGLHLATSHPGGSHQGPRSVVMSVDDITALTLSAELVTVSACEAGAAPAAFVPGREGPNYLSWAFLAAGARSVIAPSWPTQDWICAMFMHRFYQEWCGGAPRSVALARAQRSFIGGGSGSTQLVTSPTGEQIDLSQDRHWAGFTLTGDWR